MSPVANTAGTVPALARMEEIRTRFQTAPTAADPASGSTFASLLSPTAGSTTSSAPSAGATTAGTPFTGAGGTTGDQVVDAAEKYLGVPYVWGGTDPSKGLDCSGLVQRTYRDLGVELPRVARDQARVGTEVPSLDQAKPGDLIAFGRPVDHIAIYAGAGKIIQAPRTGDVVKVSDIHRPITTIRRIVPDRPLPTIATPAAGAAATPATGLGAADTVALRQLLQLVSRVSSSPGGAAGINSYTGSSSTNAFGIGGDSALNPSTAALGSLLNGTTL